VCSGGVPAPGSPRRWDTVAAMGFVKQGLAVGSFLVVVGCLCEGDWERESCFVFPPNDCRGERCGVKKTKSASAWEWFAFFGAFPLLSSGRGLFYSHGQSAIRKRARRMAAPAL
jgi:hypothetical protein